MRVIRRPKPAGRSLYGFGYGRARSGRVAGLRHLEYQYSLRCHFRDQRERVTRAASLVGRSTFPPPVIGDVEGGASLD